MNNKPFSNIILPFMIGLAGLGISSNVQAAPDEVLILDSTVTGGLSSPEAVRIAGLGFTPILVDDTTWAAMSTADFSDYEGIVLGDPTCVDNPTPVSAAEANAATWAAAVDGNVIVIGTDPTLHILLGKEGAQALTDSAMAFALDEAGTGSTGAYLSLSCYYHFSGPTTVPALAGFGAFTVQGADTTGALNDVHIVASHPSLVGLTDALLSNWDNSVHENLLTWPSDFEVLALALSGSGSYTAGDGSVGFPYIVARGVIPTECTDDDDDGVCGDADLCADTVMPEENVPTEGLGKNKFVLGEDGNFITTPPQGKGPQVSYTIEDTAGCSCEQIIDALGLGKGHVKHGCSIDAMNDWVAQVGEELPAPAGGVERGELESPNSLPSSDVVTPQLNCSMGDQPGNGAAWAFLGLVLASVGRRRRA